MRHPLFPRGDFAISIWRQIAVFISIIPMLFTMRQFDIRRPWSLVPILVEVYRWGFTTAGQIERGHIRHPDRPFLIDDHGSITYREYVRQARCLSVGMREALDLRPGDDVGILARNGRGFVMPLSATGYQGWRAVLLNVSAGVASIARSCREIGVTAIATDDEFVDDLIAAGIHRRIRLVVVDPDLGDARRAELAAVGNISFLVDHVAAAAGRENDLPLRPRQIGIVIMSSGTTSDPKGVLLPFPLTPLPGATIVKRIPWRPTLTVSFQASMFHAWGWGNLNIAGGLFCTIVTRRVFDPAVALDDAERYRCDAMVSSPVFFERMLDEDAARHRDIGPLRFLASSGNAVPPALARRTVDRLGPVLYSFYGSTEHTQVCVADTRMLLDEPMAAGTPTPGSRIAIVGADGRVLPHGEIGTVYAANAMAMRGFVTEGARIDTRYGMLSTGDLGRIDGGGCLVLFGRGDSMIINGGENIHLKAVENCIHAMTGVREVYVDADRTDPINQTPVAWMVADEEAGITVDAVREHVATTMLRHAAPSHVHLLTALPRNDAGKVMPRFLPEIEMYAAPEPPAVSRPRGEHPQPMEYPNS